MSFSLHYSTWFDCARTTSLLSVSTRRSVRLKKLRRQIVVAILLFTLLNLTIDEGNSRHLKRGRRDPNDSRGSGVVDYLLHIKHCMKVIARHKGLSAKMAWEQDRCESSPPSGPTQVAPVMHHGYNKPVLRLDGIRTYLQQNWWYPTTEWLSVRPQAIS
jgi:hypothetical protein